MMQPSDNCLALIKAFEGCCVVPYVDAAGFQTIGIGHRIKEGETFSDFTLQDAYDLLKVDVQDAADCVNELVKVTLNQNQFDALVSFVFNLGCQKLKSSSLLAFLNDGDYDCAANEFTKWVMANGKPLDGLVRRRKAEQSLFRRQLNV